MMNLPWCTPIISALGRLRQEDHKFEVSLGYIARLSLRKQTNKQNNQNKTNI
jgi:hypothetical protein